MERIIFEGEATLVNGAGKPPHVRFDGYDGPWTLGARLALALDIDEYTKYTKLGKVRVTIEPLEED